MAKKRKSDGAKVNKTALIKEAYAQNPDASPTEVAATVGHGITAKYVSTVKTNMRAAAKKGGVKRKPGRPKGSKRAIPKTATGPGGLAPAIAFIEAAGGLKAAKRQIETIEKIKRL